jgi:hypothetical protein
VTINPLTTNNTKPTLTGTVSDGTVSVTVGGQTIAATVDDNVWTATVPTALAAGSYTISVTATDLAGEGTATATNGLVIDTTLPTVTITGSPITTSSGTPTLTGTVSNASDTVSVNVAGQIIAATVDGAGNWSAAIPTAVAGGTYNISVSATDAAGNVGSTTGSLTVDSSTTVTANPLTTKSTTPTLTGTVSDSSATVMVTVGTQTFAATVSGNVWTATVPTALAASTYDISVAATDSGTTDTATEPGGLVINTTAPTVTVASLSSASATPTLTGTVSEAGSSVTVNVGGQTIKATVSGTTWSATVPTAMANGIFDVTVTATDAAGNVGTVTTDGALVVDVATASTLPFSLADGAWETLPSGVRVWNVKTGSGTAVVAGDNITVNYIGYLTNGFQFDSSFTHTSPLPGGDTFTTALNSSVITGWVDGIPGLMPGGEIRLDIPVTSPTGTVLGYGSSPPTTSIPPNSELVFDITLISSTT